jgi:3-deoxy-D-manno-octulosonic-acid transferase
LAREMGIDRARPLLVAGSTGPGEEEKVLAAYGELLERVPGLQLAIVPRKPERFDEVARLIESRGYACVRRSQRGTASNGGVFLGDTMGELRKFYSLASVVFVGRTLVPMGGSDLMEVAALGKPMCFGPYVENFADAAEKLRRADAAVQIGSPSELVAAIQGMLADGAAAKRMGRRAQDVVRQNVGATGRTVDLVCACLAGG